MSEHDVFKLLSHEYYQFTASEKRVADFIISNSTIAQTMSISDLADASRENPYVILGISPRGALAICRAAKSNAYLEGRDYVIPEDVAAIFADVCAHRLVLSSKAKLHEHTAEMITDHLLQTVAKPDHREFKVK